MFRSRLAFAMMAVLLCAGIPRGWSEPPAADKPAAPSAPARTDLYGDPLPEGAIARLGTIRLRHAGTLYSFTFSPDGKLLASSDGHVPTGKEVRVLSGQFRWGWSVAFSPDGKRLASGSNDVKVRLWDMATGAEVSTLIGHQDRVIFPSRGQPFAVR